MAISQSSKEKKQPSPRLPKDILERSDADAMDCIMGKRIRRELDKEVQAVEKPEVDEFIGR